MNVQTWTETKQWQTTIPGKGWVYISRELSRFKSDYYWHVVLVEIDDSISPCGSAPTLREAKAAGSRAAREAIRNLQIARGGA